MAVIHDVLITLEEVVQKKCSQINALRTIADPLYWSLALGACLGGNGTIVGASANVVVTQIARKNNYVLTFGDFFRMGFPTLLLSAAVSTVYIWLRYFL